MKIGGVNLVDIVFYCVIKVLVILYGDNNEEEGGSRNTVR
jgi:hypothetical protein